MKQSRQTRSQQTIQTVIAVLANLMLWLGTSPVQADHSENSPKTRPVGLDRHFVLDSNFQNGSQRYRLDRRARQFKRTHDFEHQGWQQHRIKLDLPIRFRGTDRLRLRKIAQRHYAIDLDRYRLVRVVVEGHGRRHRPGTARLIVGHHRSHDEYLNGRASFRAPDARRKANWQLKVRDAQINHVRLVLEPRFHKYAHRSDYRTHNPIRWRAAGRSPR